MFELNLIKDKAKARQRRRVIFMSIMMILLLAGLVSIFVGSLIWREQMQINRLTEQVATLEKANTALDNDLKLEEPKAVKRRNGLIKASLESEAMRNKRRYFTPALEDLFKITPEGSRFWYSAIDFQTSRPAATGNTPAAGVAPPDLLGFRTFQANGHVQIVESDTRTQQSLEKVSEKMTGMLQLVGLPTFTSQPDQAIEGRGQGNNEETRYVRFNVRAQQYYSGVGSGSGTP